jgi:EXS family
MLNINVNEEQKLLRRGRDESSLLADDEDDAMADDDNDAVEYVFDGGVWREKEKYLCARPIWFFLTSVAAVSFCSALIYLLLVDNLFYYSNSLLEHHSLRWIDMWFGLSQCLFFVWLYGVVVHIYLRNDVNYVFTLDWPRGSGLDRSISYPGASVSAPHDELRVFHLAGLASYLLFGGLVVMALIMMTHVGGGGLADGNFPIGMFPLLAFVALLALVFVPRVPPYPSTRLSFGRLLYEVAVAIVWPFYGVTFAHVVLADALTSASLTLFQLELIGCFFFTGNFVETSFADGCGAGSRHAIYARPIMYSLPFWIRFVQCVHRAWHTRQHGVRSWQHSSHLVNAGKYLSSLAVVVTSALMNGFGSSFWSIAWFVCIVVKTLYCYVWDIMMDWDLGHWPAKRADANRRRASPATVHRFPPLLRRHRIYPWTWAYYVAIVTNFFMRASWAIAISVQGVPPNWGMLMALVEIARRAQWLVFRVENEYLQKARIVRVSKSKHHLIATMSPIAIDFESSSTLDSPLVAPRPEPAAPVAAADSDAAADGADDDHAPMSASDVAARNYSAATHPYPPPFPVLSASSQPSFHEPPPQRYQEPPVPLALAGYNALYSGLQDVSDGEENHDTSSADSSSNSQSERRRLLRLERDSIPGYE